MLACRGAGEPNLVSGRGACRGMSRGGGVERSATVINSDNTG